MAVPLGRRFSFCRVSRHCSATTAGSCGLSPLRKGASTTRMSRARSQLSERWQSLARLLLPEGDCSCPSYASSPIAALLTSLPSARITPDLTSSRFPSSALAGPIPAIYATAKGGAGPVRTVIAQASGRRQVR